MCGSSDRDPVLHPQHTRLSSGLSLQLIATINGVLYDGFLATFPSYQVNPCWQRGISLINCWGLKKLDQNVIFFLKENLSWFFYFTPFRNHQLKVRLASCVWFFCLFVWYNYKCRYIMSQKWDVVFWYDWLLCVYHPWMPMCCLSISSSWNSHNQYAMDL